MLIIFDWDGTLVDSAAKIVSAMQAAIEEQSLATRNDEQIRHIIGLGLAEAIIELYPEFAGQPEPVNQLRERYSWHFINDPVQPEFFPGALTVMDSLKQRGHSLAVATGKSRRGLDRALVAAGLEDYFVASRCADETLSKPDPKMLHELLEQLATDTLNSLMVGDTSFDLEMANRAGMRSVGVTYGAHPKPRLLSCQPWQLIDSIHELPQFVGELAGS